MGTRGRISAAALSVVPTSFPDNRPAPPPELTPEQAKVWVETVDTEIGGFFSTSALRSLLAQYCRHTVSAEVVSVEIDGFAGEWLKDEAGLRRYDTLLKMRDRETKAAADKATKLRLTNQSRYTPQAASTAARQAVGGRKPWERRTEG